MALRALKGDLRSRCSFGLVTFALFGVETGAELVFSMLLISCSVTRRTLCIAQDESFDFRHAGKMRFGAHRK